VNVEIVLFGHREADVDMLAGFLVDVFVPRSPTTSQPSLIASSINSAAPRSRTIPS
jgi:hypothetical protein